MFCGLRGRFKESGAKRSFVLGDDNRVWLLRSLQLDRNKRHHTQIVSLLLARVLISFLDGKVLVNFLLLLKFCCFICFSIQNDGPVVVLVVVINTILLGSFLDACYSRWFRRALCMGL